MHQLRGKNVWVSEIEIYDVGHLGKPMVTSLKVHLDP
jgi:hypothetical protein